jgi:hypothetical protein
VVVLSMREIRKVLCLGADTAQNNPASSTGVGVRCSAFEWRQELKLHDVRGWGKAGGSVPAGVDLA